MEKYLIKYKIATVAELVNAFDYRGFRFEPATNEWWHCDAWIATKTIEAENIIKARSQFYKELLPLIERFSVVSQCAFRVTANTYFIYKLTNNKDKVIYIFYVRESGHTGLMFDEQEINQLDNFDNVVNKEALIYVAEAANASTFYTRLTMLIMGIEGLAGELVTKKEIKTNKTELITILGQPLFDQLYAYGTGIRNKLFHGKTFSNQLIDGLTEKVYDKIRDYLEQKYNIHLEKNVVNPQRNFHGNFQFAGTYEKLTDVKYLDIATIESSFDENNPKKDEVYRNIFDGIVISPANY